MRRAISARTGGPYEFRDTAPGSEPRDARPRARRRTDGGDGAQRHGAVTADEPCRWYGVGQLAFDRWKKKFGGLGVPEATPARTAPGAPIGIPVARRESRPVLDSRREFEWVAHLHDAEVSPWRKAEAPDDLEETALERRVLDCALRDA